MSSSFNPTPYRFEYFSVSGNAIGSSLADLSDEALNEVATLDANLFPNPWEKFKWEQVRNQELGPCLLSLVYKDEVLKGFSLFGIADPDTAHLYKILVEKDCRGSGLSSELLMRVESLLRDNHASSVFLEVEQSNLRALGFYQKHGYHVLVAKKGFYGPGRDAFALEHLLS